jgi:anthranilate synthase component 1
LTDEEFKHNVALAKNIVSEEMYSNWSYLVGLKASKERVQCVQSVEKHQPFLFIFFDYGDFKIFGSSPEAQIIVKTKDRILSQEL